jgi:hypothetical protein
MILSRGNGGLEKYAKLRSFACFAVHNSGAAAVE